MCSVFVLVLGRALAPRPAGVLRAKRSTTVVSQVTLAQITQT
jgi:hypothetical protein